MNTQQSYTAGSYGNYALPYVHGPVIQQGTPYYTSHAYTNTQSQVRLQYFISHLANQVRFAKISLLNTRNLKSDLVA